MSINPETDLNLEELFQPSWAKDSTKETKRYADFVPRDRPERGGYGDRPRRPTDRRQTDRGQQGGRRPGGENRGHQSRGGFKGRDTRYRNEHRPPQPPPPEVNLSLCAVEQGADSLVKQIKTTGRAYPLFDIARMILQKPDRYSARFSVKKGSDGKVLLPLFVCALDDTLWLSVDEATAHVLQNHLATFYQAERTEIDAPKGTYTFVAQCGMSGVILGPPNHHDYQNKLHELHTQRFSRMPFETYKSRVKIVRDEEVVKKWVEDQSWKTEYTCLNVPESLRLPDMAAVEKHFREIHLSGIVTEVESHSVHGQNCNKLRGGLGQVYRGLLEQQRRFPMQIATSLSQQFASRGLQFFKVNKTITHVWVAKPTHLDVETSHVSDGIKRIVQFVDAHPKCTRRQLIETLSPSPTPAPTEETATAEPDAATKPADTEPTAEQTVILGDLHWLIHQGHVIEFANGLMETAKKPLPKPVKPAQKKAKQPKKEDKKAETAEKPAAEGAASETISTKPTEAKSEVKAETAAPSTPVAAETVPPVVSEQEPITQPEPGVEDVSSKTDSAEPAATNTEADAAAPSNPPATETTPPATSEPESETEPKQS